MRKTETNPAVRSCSPCQTMPCARDVESKRPIEKNIVGGNAETQKSERQVNSLPPALGMDQEMEDAEKERERSHDEAGKS